MYSLDEVGLIPAIVSNIRHRADINPFIQSPFGGNKLPIFVAPMTCILNANNICEFSKSAVEPILPVGGDYGLRIQLPNGSDWLGWTAVTLQEFDYMFNQAKVPANRPYYVLIDIANGHISEVYEMVKHAKDLYPKLSVMIGNIANPQTYIECCKAGIDYIRVGIGGGSGCTTSVQTGIHAGMPWLLTEIQKYKEFMSANMFKTKVIADGGVNTISKAIKCLALGADYVMMGKCFAECEEACGKTELVLGKKKRIYYGQASKEGQMDRFGKIKSNPEGIAKWIPVKYSLREFTDKFEAALRSAMSYCNANTLNDFIGKVRYEYMSQAEFNAFIK